MEILHLFRTRQEVTQDASQVVSAQGARHTTRVFYLEDRAGSPEGFDQDLFRALREADRVVSW